jgi:hypothetical protein
VTIGRVSREDARELDGTERAPAEQGHERREDRAAVSETVRDAEAASASTEEELVAPHFPMKLPKCATAEPAPILAHS